MQSPVPLSHAVRWRSIALQCARKTAQALSLQLGLLVQHARCGASMFHRPPNNGLSCRLCLALLGDDVAGNPKALKLHQGCCMRALAVGTYPWRVQSARIAVLSGRGSPLETVASSWTWKG